MMAPPTIHAQSMMMQGHRITVSGTRFNYISNWTIVIGSLQAYIEFVTIVINNTFTGVSFLCTRVLTPDFSRKFLPTNFEKIIF